MLLILPAGSRSRDFSAFQLRFVGTVNVKPRLVSCPSARHQRQMIDDDVGLNRVIGLAVPFPRLLDQIQVVSKGELLQAAGLHGIRIVNDDLRPDVIPVLIPVAQDRADLLPVHVVLADLSGAVGNNHRLPSVRFQGFLRKNVPGKPQFPADTPVRVPVFKNADGGQDRVIHQIPFLREIRPVVRIQADAVQTAHPPKYRRCILLFHLNHLLFRIKKSTHNRCSPSKIFLLFYLAASIPYLL